VTGLLGLLLLIAGLVLVPALRSPDAPPAPGRNTGARPSRTAPPTLVDEEPRDTPSRSSGLQDLVTGPVLPAADPVLLTIPRLGISSSSLESLGVDDKGAMEVPQDPAEAGWYELGPPPGALGPAVIAGHVTWNQVPAVFYRLTELRRGDVVEITRTDGRVAVFEIIRVRLYDKSSFPTRMVFGPIDHAGLRLITCGGAYERSVSRYRGNVVAFARLLSSH